MFLSRMILLRLPLIGGLAAAAAALLVAAAPAAAQPPGASKLWPWNVQGASAVAPSPARVATPAPAPAPRQSAFTGPLDVTIVERAAPTPLVVTLRGPGAEVRTFQVPAGRQAIRTREVIVHPGEQLTIPVPPSAKVEAPPAR
jgi:hypothetical protein